jgi:excisionase family DNA binding protein
MLDTKTLTVTEAADALHVSRGLVLRLIAEERLVAYKIGSGRGHYRIPLPALEAYIKSCRTIPEEAS